jgi:hypothetical protein
LVFTQPASHVKLHCPSTHSTTIMKGGNGQAFPQEPQLKGSFMTSAHVLAPLESSHATKPSAQPPEQLPRPSQTWELSHRTPHWPQFMGSVMMFTHSPSHSIHPAIPEGQAQEPSWQKEGASQTVPQAPQFRLSVMVSVH